MAVRELLGRKTIDANRDGLRWRLRPPSRDVSGAPLGAPSGRLSIALKVTPIRTGAYLTAPSNRRAASCPMITSANPPTSRWKSEGFNVWVMPDQTRRPVETS